MIYQIVLGPDESKNDALGYFIVLFFPGKIFSQNQWESQQEIANFSYVLLCLMTMVICLKTTAEADRLTRVGHGPFMTILPSNRIDGPVWCSFNLIMFPFCISCLISLISYTLFLGKFIHFLSRSCVVKYKNIIIII